MGRVRRFDGGPVVPGPPCGLWGEASTSDCLEDSDFYDSVGGSYCDSAESCDGEQDSEDSEQLGGVRRRLGVGGGAVDHGVLGVGDRVATPDNSSGSTPNRASRFRVQASTFLLTWPQCDRTVRQCLEYLASIDGHEWSAAVRESHSDGSPHLHAVVHFASRRDIRNARFFDLGTSHANIVPVKAGRGNLYRVLNYLQKEVLNRVEGATLPEVVGVSSFTELLIQFQKTKGVLQDIAERVAKGATMTDLLQEPHLLGALLMHGSKIGTFQSLLEVAQLEKTRKPYDLNELKAMRCQSVAAQRDWTMIISWLDHMIRKPLPFRPLQLWIRGPPAIGKSYLTWWLKNRLRLYVFPRREFHDLWSNACELIVDDDHAPTQRIQDLLRWSDGSTMTVDTKGGTKIKSGPYPFMVFSNDPPHQIYGRVSDYVLDALVGKPTSRFHYIDWVHAEPFPFPVDTTLTRWNPFSM